MLESGMQACYNRRSQNRWGKGKMERTRCVLYDRECIECGECNLCDLDPTKICDNCKKCIGLDNSTEYRAIKIDGIIDESLDPADYLDE